MSIGAIDPIGENTSSYSAASAILALHAKLHKETAAIMSQARLQKTAHKTRQEMDRLLGKNVDITV